MNAYEVSISVSDEKAAIAWHGGQGGRDDIYFQWLDAKGRQRSAPMRITDGALRAFEPDLQLANGNPFLAWYQRDSATEALTAWLARLDADGKILWRQRLDGEGGEARNPVLRIANGALHVAWIETPNLPEAEPEVWTNKFDLQGRSTGTSRRVGRASANTWNLNATVDGHGVFYVVYDARLGGQANELQVLAIDGAKVRHRQLTSEDGYESVYPDIGHSQDGHAALTWFDGRDGNEEVYLAAMPLDDLISGPQLSARRISYTAAASIGAYLAWNGDRLALVWSDAQSGQGDLYSQFFESSGEPRSRIRQLTDFASHSSIPSVRAFGSGFLIGWNEYEAISANGHQEILSSVAMTERLP